MKIPDNEEELNRVKESAKACNNNCFYYDDSVLLYGTISTSHIKDTISLIDSLKSKGYNVMPIYDYKLDSDEKTDTIDFEKFQNGWVYEKRAKGIHLYQDMETIHYSSSDSDIDVLSKYYEELRRYTKELVYTSKINQKFYDDFAKLYYEVFQSNLTFEPLNNHLFYDEEEGFSLVGMHYEEAKGKAKGLFINDFINLLLYQPCYIVSGKMIIDDIPEEIYSSLKSSVSLILDKAMNALHKLPVKRSTVDELFMNYLNSKKYLFNGGISQEHLMNLLNSSVNTDNKTVNSIK